jgi:hypothetical protein
MMKIMYKPIIKISSILYMESNLEIMDKRQGYL